MPRDIERDTLEAQHLLANEYLARVIAGLEADAVDRAMAAPASDHDTRQSAMAYVRAMRDFRQALQSAAIAGETSQRRKRGTPA
jgi:hypothetical protein